MVIIRNMPNTHKIGDVFLHPGAQFIDDAVYHSQLKDNEDFKGQLKAFLEVVVPAVDAAKLKDAKDTPKCLADVVAKLDDKTALSIVSKTVDILDIEEIIKTDRRRPVISAATDQREQRSAVMNSLAPKISASDGKAMRLPGFEDAKDFVPGAK
jgi:hypothetical protein